MAVDTEKYLDFVAGVTSPASSDLPQLLSRMTELDVTDDGQVVRKEQVDVISAREALRKQHKRQGRVRNRISLNEFIDQTGGGVR